MRLPIVATVVSTMFWTAAHSCAAPKSPKSDTADLLPPKAEEAESPSPAPTQPQERPVVANPLLLDPLGSDEESLRSPPKDGYPGVGSGFAPGGDAESVFDPLGMSALDDSPEPLAQQPSVGDTLPEGLRDHTPSGHPMEITVIVWALTAPTAILLFSLGLAIWLVLHGKPVKEAATTAVELLPATSVAVVVGFVAAAIVCGPLLFISSRYYYAVAPLASGPLAILFGYFAVRYVSRRQRRLRIHKLCQVCGRMVPPASRVGLRCPHCGAAWDHQARLSR